MQIEMLWNTLAAGCNTGFARKDISHDTVRYLLVGASSTSSDAHGSRLVKSHNDSTAF